METRTFRGRTLDEVVPRIRAELGADAVILRRRDGIVGGIGGFFGRRCVEVDAASAPAAAPMPAVPARSVFDAYDAAGGDDAEPAVIRTAARAALSGVCATRRPMSRCSVSAPSR